MPTAPHATTIDLLVLHTLRCIGYAGRARVAEATGLSESDAESELIDLAVAGLVTHLPGEFGGWGLTDAGRTADAERISAELDTAGTRAAVAEAYDDFLALNPELLDLCTAWQLRPTDGVAVTNDHSDAEYDSRVLDRFADLNERADAACGDLFASMLRFRRYQDRLTTALALAQAGDLDYLTDGLSSYHVVWSQLHEDLLATLGIPRT